MPLFDLFWAMLWFFLFFAWIWILVSVVFDVFRSKDLSGWAKALWVLFIVVLPLLGVLIYLIARGDKMQENAATAARQQDAAFRQYVQTAAGSGASPAEELAKLNQLRNDGVISEEEFQRLKAKTLDSASA